MQPLWREEAAAASSRSARAGRPRVVEDVLVGARARAEDVGIAREQPEVWGLGARCIHQAREVALGELGFGQRLEPGQPFELRLREAGGVRVVRIAEGRFGGHEAFSRWK